jgi:PAS domain S-box-containing protein
MQTARIPKDGRHSTTRTAPVRLSPVTAVENGVPPIQTQKKVPAAEEIRATLDRILSHAPFRRSPQLRAFLTYIVDVTLAGHGSLLKSYRIATEALGRPADFDPVTDAIVRVEAKRLRQVLTGIYADPECDLPIRIDIPVGRYEPIFSPVAPAAGRGTEQGRTPSIAPDLEKLRANAKHAKALIDSEERYRALVQASAAVEWRADADGRPVHSLGWTERTGQDAAGLKDGGWLKAIHPDDREKTGRAWDRALLAGERMEATFRVLHRDGHYRWMLARGVPIEEADGTIREWIGTVADIQDSMETVETLRAEAERLRQALEAARLIAWELDTATGTMTYSDNSRAILGIGPGSVSDLYALIHPGDRERAVAALDAAVRNGQDCAQAFLVMKPEGDLVRVALRGGCKPSQTGRFAGVLAIDPVAPPFTAPRRGEVGRSDGESAIREDL